MRRIPRIALLAVFIGVLPVLAGCADFDPDKLDIFGLSEKKKLPGDRKDLFPEGVPGVTQGVPREYIKGNQQLQTGAEIPIEPVAAAPVATAPVATAPVAAAPPPAAQPKPKRVAKPKPAPKPATQPAPTAAAAPAQQPVAQQPPQAWPAPQPQPAQQSQQPGRLSNGPAPWPSAPPPGTFSQ